MRAIVLAAGYGTRLGELTRERPKPMLAVGRAPLLEHILRHLARQGIDDILVNLHFRPEIVRAHFGDGSRFGIRLAYVEEPALLGTAGSVRNVADFLRGSDPFLVHYGDILTNQDLGAMVVQHRRHGGLATLLVHWRRRSNSVIDLDREGRVLAFRERPADPPPGWAFSGICVCDPRFLDELPSDTPADLPRDVFAPRASELGLHACRLTGYRCAVDSPQRLAEVRRAVEAGELRLA